MRKLILWMHQSADGYFEGPKGAWDFDWPTVTPVMQREFHAEARNAGAFLYGRRVYEGMCGYWPTADVEPTTPEAADYARVWKPMPKIVFSRTLEAADWNTRIVRENIAEEVAALKQQPGGDLILYGGGEIAAEFDRLGLIDEYVIFVHPILLGGGRPLFATQDLRRPLRLIESRVFDPGVIMQRYAHANEA